MVYCLGTDCTKCIYAYTLLCILILFSPFLIILMEPCPNSGHLEHLWLSREGDLDAFKGLPGQHVFLVKNKELVEPKVPSGKMRICSCLFIHVASRKLPCKEPTLFQESGTCPWYLPWSLLILNGHQFLTLPCRVLNLIWQKGIVLKYPSDNSGLLLFAWLPAG
jgi:hypothetical protein